jgi:hypothetical protein
LTNSKNPLHRFTSKIEITGINPYVLVPDDCLRYIWEQAGKNKSPIPVKGTIDGHKFIQTLVKFKGDWLLYLNGFMRKAAAKDVGDVVEIQLEFDPEVRSIPMHPKLATALQQNKEANAVFKKLSPSLQKEIVRYISHLKTEESVDRNITRAIRFLLGEERFIGRDKPIYTSSGNKNGGL